MRPEDPRPEREQQSAARDELERRRASWKPLEPRYTTGVLGKYAKLVGSAAQGAVTG